MASRARPRELAGFSVRGVLIGYLRDPRSQDFATLLEWVRPS